MRKREYFSNERAVQHRSAPWLPPQEHFIWSFEVKDDCGDLVFSIGDAHRFVFYPTRRQAVAIGKALLKWGEGE